MNAEPKSNKPTIKRLRETAADLISEKIYIACAGCDNGNSMEVGKDIRWALREIKRLNTLLSGLYATAQANHDAKATFFVEHPTDEGMLYYVGQPGCVWSHSKGKAWPMHEDRARQVAREEGGRVISALSNVKDQTQPETNNQ